MAEYWHCPMARKHTSSGEFTLRFVGSLLLRQLGLLRWKAQILADFLGQVVVDFRVPRNRRSLTCGTVNVDRMVGAFAQQFTSVSFEVSNEFTTLQALTFSGSRITSFPEAAS